MRWTSDPWERVRNLPGNIEKTKRESQVKVSKSKGTRRFEPSTALMTIVFGTIAVISALFVITEKNTIHSVFYLVLAFVNSALILIIWGVDYLGLLLIIVYVGAIAILFLFVVMMINIKNEEINRTRYVPIGIIIAIVLMLEVYVLFPEKNQVEKITEYSINGGESNVHLLGELLYNWEVIMYGGLVLLVAMIGAIVLTLSHSEGVKRQELFTKWT